MIETMVSSALFFVGLTAVFSTYSTAARILGHHRNVTRAVAIAEGTIEELVQRYPGDPLLDVGVTPTARNFDNDGLLAASASKYAVTWTVATFALLDGIREVTVIVTWSEEGTSKKLTLKTWRS